MVDIEKLKPEIIERLRPLNPDKITLFGSYACGTPNEDSDIDLFLVKDDIAAEDIRQFEIKSHLALKELIKKYKIGFDILSASTDFLRSREDHFYKIDILKHGKVIYGE